MVSSASNANKNSLGYHTGSEGSPSFMAGVVAEAFEVHPTRWWGAKAAADASAKHKTTERSIYHRGGKCTDMSEAMAQVGFPVEGVRFSFVNP